MDILESFAVTRFPGNLVVPTYLAINFYQRVATTNANIPWPTRHWRPYFLGVDNPYFCG
jgi:hypothetical protein